jgi:hypothetical protein
MLKRKNIGPVLVAVLLALPALAADRAGDLVIINTHTPKPGATAKYEAARVKHMAWHKAQKDPWSWLTWEIVSGEASGTYYTGSFGHAWKELDGQEKLEKADIADFDKNIGPTLGRSFTSYYLLRPDLSLTQPSGDPPSAYSVLTFFLLNPDGANDFLDTVKKINEGIKKTSHPQPGPSSWYQLVNGGEGPMYVLSGGRANWAAFAPPGKTLDQMMEEAYGKEQGAAILAKGRKAIRSQRTETIKYRPDLSYVAPKETAGR